MSTIMDRPAGHNLDGTEWVEIWQDGDWRRIAVSTLKTIGPQGLQGVQGIQGPRGEKGVQGPLGPQGPQGIQGPRGEVGATGPVGKGYIPKGTLPSFASLIAQAGIAKGDTWVVADVAFSYDGVRWVNMGLARGPKGDTGNAGPAGAEGPQGLKGDVGSQGPMGPGLVVLGGFASEDELPATGDFGEGYLIDTHYWGWTGDKFEDLGPVQGPAGVQGPMGPRGLPGDPGVAGTPGAVWISLARPPVAQEGQVGDHFIDITDNSYYEKTDETTWSLKGRMGGGNVYDAASNGKKYVRLNGEWVELAEYTEEAPKNDGIYARKNGQWIDLSYPPEDGKTYVYRNRQWVEYDPTFDRYTLRVAETENVLDLNAQQVFLVDGRTSKVLSFQHVPPSGRAMVVMVRVIGNGGIVTWPDNIQWSGAAQPILAASFTNVTLLWDGMGWTGAAWAAA